MCPTRHRTPDRRRVVDHRVPELRWETSEDFEYESMTDREIEEHFQILTRSHNLLIRSAITT